MAKICLLITEQLEPTADWLMEELRLRGVSCVRWNLDRFPIGSFLTFQASGGVFSAEIVTDGRKVDLATVGSIWCRGFRPCGLPESMPEADRIFAQVESQRAFDALLTITDAFWVNHPQRHARANSKPAQLFVAQHVGFEIPTTIITNDPEHAYAFVSQGEEQSIYKTMSQGLRLEEGKALFTGLVTEEELRKMDLIHLSPGIFQRFVPKAYEIRATVIGQRIFSGKIDSQTRVETQIDWRHRPFDIDRTPVGLPAQIEAQIHAFMHMFGLVYGAFDFIVTPEGRYIFLEVNPAGQYMWVETATGLPITAALADALSDPLT